MWSSKLEGFKSFTANLTCARKRTYNANGASLSTYSIVDATHMPILNALSKRVSTQSCILSNFPGKFRRVSNS